MRWAATGGVPKRKPAASPPLFAGQFVGEGPNTVPVRHANGNIVGGVRSPSVDVPIARLTGEGNTPAGFCALTGKTYPFTSAQLHALYPTHDVFVQKRTANVKKLVGEGYIARADGENPIRAAELDGGLF